ncbi:rRNA maturation endonuclease Nob1 [Scopulibacillus daqui]|uniref:rRNA maturation endonuclease Nob1 n=1 Tax=Scopulibacillus daqui TaxID=1469162 RepID=A0ABS2Q159_9BACL|nr:rRNA maturation endonuclease Nob1 [Scopulibacillus daqui]
MKKQKSYCSGCYTIQDVSHNECCKCGNYVNKIIIEVQNGNYSFDKTSKWANESY